ncbi:methyltransferase, partial [Amycolatopsis sp. NPDC059090]
MAHKAAMAGIMNVALGHMASQALYVAARMKLADRLADGPAETGQLASECAADPALLGRLLRALAAAEVLEQRGPELFALAPMGHALRDGVPNSARNFVLTYLSPPVWNAWADLETTVRTGETAFDRVHGMGAFDYCAAHPDVAAVFHRAMAEDAAQVAEVLAEEFDFSAFGTVADIGGGNGTLLAAVLAATPDLRGILFDTELGVAAAPDVLAGAGVSDRCETVAGDFFAGVPRADAHLLKSVVHDWDDDAAVRLLSTCRRSLPDTGRVLLVERVLPVEAPAGPDPALVRHQLAGPVIMG